MGITLVKARGSEDGSMSPTLLLDRIQRRLQAEQADAEFLAAFAGRPDQDAFRALVEGYGPLVWSVCRRQLSDSHSAEDATQAVFLTLVRQASRVRPEALAGWLVCVARRIARKARLAQTRRQRREAAGARSVVAPPITDDLSLRELLAVLDEEVAKLPERYRSALLSCYWQGLPQAESARQQGITASALKGLLERGRAKLLERLRQRGLTADVALRGLLVAPLALAALPGDLLAQTVSLIDGPAPPGVAKLIPATGFLRWGATAIAAVALGIGFILVPRREEK